jgi:hypothetical protein
MRIGTTEAVPSQFKFEDGMEVHPGDSVESIGAIKPKKEP